MNTITTAGTPHFGRSRAVEAFTEAGLAVAAAAFTAVVWLSLVSAGSGTALALAAQQADSRPLAVRYVTLPPVIVIGHREAPQATAAVTTAQDTAAFPVTLQQ